MTKHRLAAIASVIFLLAAAFSGGSAVLFLQDSEMVTVTFGNVGNTADDSGVEELSTSSTNWSEEDGVLVALEPADQSTTAGDNVTYDVVVKGASEGIGAYFLKVELNDSDVATFEGYTSNYERFNDTLDVSVEEDVITASAGTDEALTGLDEYALGTITVNSSSAGQVDLTIHENTMITSKDESMHDVGENDSSRQNGTLTVTTTNSPPTANPDNYTVKMNNELVVPPSDNVTQNDIDPDGDALSVSTDPVSGPEHGELWLYPDGTFEYHPDNGFTGEDTFEYRVSDGYGGNDTATVTITIEKPGNGPNN